MMQKVCSIAAWSSLLMGALFLFCWHCHFMGALQCGLCPWPVPYPATVCLLLSGIALFSLTYSKTPNLLGCAIFLFGLQRTAELLWPSDSILNVVLNSFPIFPVYFSQMRLTAAMGFIFIGVAFMFWRRNVSGRVQNIVPLLMTVLVIFFGSLGIITNVFPFKIEEEFRTILMHLYTAIGMFLIGVGFLFARFRAGHAALGVGLDRPERKD